MTASRHFPNQTESVDNAMNIKLFCSAVVATVLASSASATGSTDSILSIISTHSDPMLLFIGRSWENPAIKFYSHTTPLSKLSAGYDRRHDSEIIEPAEGTGEHHYYFQAESFMPAGETSVIWGDAGYSNGSVTNVSWCESADPEIIYPYFTADETWGPLHTESYNFSGDFAMVNRRITWGVTLGYKATHGFRNVDPRPHNITGNLNLSAGIAWSVPNGYKAGVALGVDKYNQSNDISFVSETFDTPIYQLTGLGTDYNRFAGASKSAGYNGSRFMASMNLFPLNKGCFVNVAASRFTFSKILNDLNKLPLANVWHNAVSAQVGIKKSGSRNDFAVSGEFEAYRRHGSENIFVDATSGSYPLIGSLGMYADNSYRASVNGLMSLKYGERIYSAWIGCTYAHRNQVYAYPEREWLINTITPAATLRFSTPVGRRWYTSAQATFRAQLPTRTNLDLSDEGNLPAFDALLNRSFELQTDNIYHTTLELTAARSLTRRQAFGLTTMAQISNLSGGASRKQVAISLNFYF